MQEHFETEEADGDKDKTPESRWELAQDAAAAAATALGRAIHNSVAALTCSSLLRAPELHAELKHRAYGSTPSLTTFHRGATPTELYFDLVYFMPLQRLSTRALGWDNVFDFWLYYVAIFNAWLGQAFFNNRFDTDDLLARVFALMKMTCVVGMAAGVPTDLETDGVEAADEH
jgi:hypothetical protein